MRRAVTPATGIRRGRSGVVHRGRLASHRPRRHGGELCHGSLAEIHLADGAEHLVSDVPPVDPVTERLHRPRGVHARHEREPVLHPVLQVALEDGVVERVQPGGRNPDPHLSFSWLGNADVLHRTGLSEFVDGEGLHPYLPPRRDHSKMTDSIHLELHPRVVATVRNPFRASVRIQVGDACARVPG